MGNIYICSDPVLKENYPHSIIERNEEGALVGAYTGYYDFKSFAVRLYPKYHPFVVWRAKPNKILISASLIKCTPPKKELGNNDKKQEKLEIPDLDQIKITF